MRNNRADITRCLISLTTGTRVGFRSRFRWFPFRRFRAENFMLVAVYKLPSKLFSEFLERFTELLMT